MLYIILPAFNEVQALPHIFRDIQEQCAALAYRIVVVNDGSTDGTGPLLRRCQRRIPDLKVVEHSDNRGLGQALLSGFYYAVQAATAAGNDLNQGEEAPPDVIITLDADNTHPADRIPLLYEAIQNGADLAIASRFTRSSRQFGLSAERKLLSWGAGTVLRLFFPVKGLRDYSCGFRAYRLPLMRRALQTYHENLIECRSFAAMVEVLLKILPLCKNIREVPLELHYERKQSLSKLRAGATIREYLLIIYRLKRAMRSSLEWAGQ